MRDVGKGQILSSKILDLGIKEMAEKVISLKGA